MDPDHALRRSALDRTRELTTTYQDLVPLQVLRQGFVHNGARVSFGSFMKGIHRAKEQQGSAALTLMTAAEKPGQARQYDDLFDLESRVALYHYRSGSPDQPDNRALRAALELQAPLIYFHGLSPGQYHVIAPVFVTEDDPVAGMVTLDIGLPHQDTQGAGLVTSEDLRRYEFSHVLRRYHQAQFRRDVMRAYESRCAVCALREPELVEASHIIRDVDADGVASIVNGLALCAIHHLAYDRNLLGIDPSGVVHIGARLLNEVDGPMLRTGLQGFHGYEISQPQRESEKPDPDRLAVRFNEFEAA